MWEELGISGGTAIIVLIALYFIIKWAVKNGVKEAYRDINEKRETDMTLRGFAGKVFAEEKAENKDPDIDGE